MPLAPPTTAQVTGSSSSSPALQDVTTGEVSTENALGGMSVTTTTSATALVTSREQTRSSSRLPLLFAMVLGGILVAGGIAVGTRLQKRRAVLRP